MSMAMDSGLVGGRSLSTRGSSMRQSNSLQNRTLQVRFLSLMPYKPRKIAALSLIGQSR